MSLDPNWFYSSLAQTAAALVGLLGGVLVTRLQGQIGDSKSARQIFVRTLRAVREEAMARLPFIRGVCEHALGVVSQLEEAEQAQQLEIRVQTDWRLTESLTGNPRVCVSERQLRRAEFYDALSLLPIVAALAQVDQSDAVAGSARQINSLSFRKGTAQATIVDDMRTKAQAHLDAAAHLQFKSSVRMFVLMLAILVWLSVAGIVAPLWFLTALTGWSKLTLLTAFSIGISFLLGYVGWQVKELLRLGSQRLLEDDKFLES